MPNLITAHLHDINDVHYVEVDGEMVQHCTDRLYVLGADIADPETDPSSVRDDSTDPAGWAFVIEVESAEDEQPYRDALAQHDLTVIGTDAAGDWILEQSAPLRTR